MSDQPYVTTEYPWGLLLITDKGSTEEVPEWAGPTEVVAVARTTLVARVRHQDEGPVEARVLTSRIDALGEMVFDGGIAVGSGTLQISDANGQSSIEVAMPVGDVRVAIFVDDPSEATRVDVVLG